MREQATMWEPLPRPRLKVAKTADVKARVDTLIDWFRANKPANNVVSLNPEDYAALERDCGRSGISLGERGLQYRGFEIRRANHD